MSLSKNEENILASIHVASEDDPSNPEFPPDNPKFPATATYQIEVPGFSDVWLKDESQNSTWTHKDRMAWEIVVTYRDFLLSKRRWQLSWDLPSMSIISSGSAAYAIQTMLRKYDLPSLKTLVDSNVDTKILNSLKSIWCKIYMTDLWAKAYSSSEILELTENKDWFDITSNEALSPTARFYDWLSYEIINNSPDYCFIPFWTWNLYENILNINKKETSSDSHDPRFCWEVKKLQKCNFIWATTNNLNSKADKLYSPHLPFVHFDEQWIKLYRYAWYCWDKSEVHIVKEIFINEALSLASSQNISCEPSWIAWLALLLQMKDEIPKDKKILIVNTGKSKCL